MYHTCALTDQGEVRCWGNNFDGELNVPADLGPAIAIAAGGGHTCAQTHTGVRCWGANNYGQTEVPTNLANVRSLKAGFGHTCVQTDQGVTCWGNPLSKVPPDLGTVDSIAVAGFVDCALKNKALRCWGENPDHVLDVPSDLGPVDQVAVGPFHICALTQTGLRCWGINTDGQLDVPANLGRFLAVGAGDGHTCALTESYGVRCWGAWYAEQCAVPPDFIIPSYVPSIMAWDWKCSGTISGKAVPGGRDTCQSESLKIYHLTTEYFRVRGSLECAADKYGPNLFVDNRIDSGNVLDAYGAVIGQATDSELSTEESFPNGDKIKTSIFASLDGGRLSLTKNYSDASSAEKLKIELECHK